MEPPRREHRGLFLNELASSAGMPTSRLRQIEETKRLREGRRR
jgi:hypothetical protein